MSIDSTLRGPEYFIKVPIKKKDVEIAKSVGMGKSYITYQYLGFLCFRRYILGKARWDNKVVKCQLPFFPLGESTVFLIIDKRDKTRSPKYEYPMNKAIPVYDKTIYVFGSVVGDFQTLAFYGWMTGEELQKARRYHPEGEVIKYMTWSRDEGEDTERTWTNKWEHYGVVLERVHELPPIEAQQDIRSWFSSDDKKVPNP